MKPEREPYNYTAHMGEDDYNDVYTGRYGWTMGRNDMEYELQIEAYSTSNYIRDIKADNEDEAIQNKSLFIVDGQERVIFDHKISLDMSNSRGMSLHRCIRARG